MNNAGIMNAIASYGRLNLGYGPPGTVRFIRCMLQDVGGYHDVDVTDAEPWVVTIRVSGVRRWWWPLTLGIRAARERRRMKEILDQFRPAGVVYAYEVA